MSDDNKLASNLQTAATVIGATATVATSLVTLFKQLAETGEALNDLSLPNVPFPTMGGHVFWNELANVNGWKLQKNMVTGHCRILDPDDIRRAWGGEEAMLKALKELT